MQAPSLGRGPSCRKPSRRCHSVMPSRCWRAKIGIAATKRFHDLLKANTPASIFKGFYDLYLEGLSLQALLIFKDLADIGLANEPRLGAPHLVWVEAQAQHLVRSKIHTIRNWIQNVCDKHSYDPNEDREEQIFWRKWQAPMFLVMTPSRYKPYDPATAWERNDAVTSQQWLDSFAQHYVLHLEGKIKKAAGEAALELAKQPRPVQSDRSAVEPTQGSSPAAAVVTSQFTNPVSNGDTRYKPPAKLIFSQSGFLKRQSE
jgi:hypothetical protein